MDCGFGHISKPPTFSKFIAQHSSAMACEAMATLHPSMMTISRPLPNVDVLAACGGENDVSSFIPGLSECQIMSALGAYAKGGDRKAKAALSEYQALPPLPSPTEILLLGFPSKLEMLRHQHTDMDIAESRLFVAQCVAYSEVYDELKLTQRCMHSFSLTQVLSYILFIFHLFIFRTSGTNLATLILSLSRLSMELCKKTQA